MRIGRIAAGVLALVGLLCFPAGAGAKSGHGRAATQQWIDFDLDGSAGYSIHVSVNPHRHLILKVTKGEYTAEYITRDLLADNNRVKARLLGLGTISVRFHPRGRLRHPSLPGCKGKSRPVVQPGVVRGTIGFIGEREYTRVNVRKAEAAMEMPTRPLCRYGERFEPDSRRRDWVSKFSADTVGAYLLARKYRPGVIEGGRVLYMAETGEAFRSTSRRRLPLTIYRRISVPALASTFDDARPEQLTASPPPPFSGTARLTRSPESVFAWTGDLAVQFPGLDPVPFAGPDFGSEYCLRDTGCFRQQGRYF